MPKRSNTKEFIEKATVIHGKKYGYDKTIYVRCMDNVEIYCFYHKYYFWQTPNMHLKGSGCIKCGHIKTAKALRSSKEEFEEKAILIHGYKYNYDLVVYIGCQIQVIIICLTCNKQFPQLPNDHLDGHGCSWCSKTKKKTTEEFVNEAQIIHKDKNGNQLYDYKESIYINGTTEVKILCLTCKKYFWQTPKHHVYEQCGCSNCSIFKTEPMVRDMIEKITNLEFPKCHPKFLKSEISKKGLELDCYNYNLKLAIEIDGIGHYKFNKFFHETEEKFEKQKERDLEKNNLCKKNNITLIRIPHQYSYKNKTELWNFLIDQLKLTDIFNKLDIIIFDPNTEC
jgi:hypothetical protein